MRATTSTPRQKHLQQRSCRDLPQIPLLAPVPSGLLHPLHANPTGYSGAVITANPMCNSGCLPAAWPTPSSHPVGEGWAPPVPQGQHPKKALPVSGERAWCSENVWGYLWQRAGLVPRGAGPLSPVGREHPSIPGSRRAGCKLPGASPSTGAGTHTSHPAPARKGPMHHLPPSE